MPWKVASATAAAVVFFASPASAANYTICEGDVRNEAGKTRMRGISPVILVEPGVDIEAAWRKHILPKLEGGKVLPSWTTKAACWPATDDKALVSQVRTTRMNASRAGGIRVIEVSFGEATIRKLAQGGSASASDSAERSTPSAESMRQSETAASSEEKLPADAAKDSATTSKQSPKVETEAAEQFTWCHAHNGDGASAQARAGGPTSYLSHVFSTRQAAGPLSILFQEMVPTGFVSRCHPGFATKAEAEASRAERASRFPKNRPTSVWFDPD